MLPEPRVRALLAEAEGELLEAFDRWGDLETLSPEDAREVGRVEGRISALKRVLQKVDGGDILQIGSG